MKSHIAAVTLLVLAAAFVPSNAHADALTADQIMESYRSAYYYAGADRKAHILLDIFDKDGGHRVRELTEVRSTHLNGGAKKMYLYFHQPSDVKRMAMIIFNYPDRADDRWVYVPAMNAVRRIAAMDEGEGFVGSDFAYEDGGGRDVGIDTNRLVKQEQVSGRDCYVIESVPKTPKHFAKREFWIDKSTFLPLRYRYYDLKGKPWKMVQSEGVEMVKAGDKTYPTLMKTTMKDIQSGGYSVWSVKNVSYDTGINDDDFVERHLQNPPRDWLKK